MQSKALYFAPGVDARHDGFSVGLHGHRVAAGVSSTTYIVHKTTVGIEEGESYVARKLVEFCSKNL